jgi:hypothetical protein
MAADNFKDFLNMADVVKHFREISTEGREHLLQKLSEEHNELRQQKLPYRFADDKTPKRKDSI